MRVFRRSLLLSFFVLLLALPAAAQPTPLSAPLSPEHEATLAGLHADPRAIEGAVIIGRFNYVSCNVGGVAIDVPYVVPAGQTLVLRFTITQGAQTFNNVRTTVTSPSYVFNMGTSNQSSGGPTNGTYPLDPNQFAYARAMLLTLDGRPLWYAEARFECDNTTNSLHRDGPVTILNVNPSFDTAGATNKQAAKWTLSTRAKRTCKVLAPDCAIEMKGVVGVETIAQQVKKHKLGWGSAGALFGVSAVYDTDDAVGTLNVSALLRDDNSVAEDGIGAFATLAGDAQNVEFFRGLTAAEILDWPIDRVTIFLSRGIAAEGKLYLRGFYVWGFDQ